MSTPHAPGDDRHCDGASSPYDRYLEALLRTIDR
jgi:hypothetical protein